MMMQIVAKKTSIIFILIVMLIMLIPSKMVNAYVPLGGYWSDANSLTYWMDSSVTNLLPLRLLARHATVPF
jgi:hypothetical protein